MKKYVFMVLTMFSMVCYGQNDSVPTITEAERIIDKYGGKISESFYSFVDKSTPMIEDGLRKR